MSLIIYLIGFVFVIGGIGWALVVAGLSTIYGDGVASQHLTKSTKQKRRES